MIQAYHIAKTEEEKTAIISEYAREKLGMTAHLPSAKPVFQEDNNSDNEDVPNLVERCNEEDENEDEDEDEEVPALSKRFVELTDGQSDICQLCHACHMHKCNGFCMRNFGKR
jgi:pseudouridine-5'-phosphate glycosidase